MSVEERDRSADPPESRVVRRRLRRRAETVRDEQLAAALSSLEARGDLTDEQRAAVAEVATAVAAGVIGPPAAALRDGAADGQLSRTVARLFDPDGERPR